MELDHVPFEMIDEIFKIIGRCPLHTFLLLTKRPQRMKKYLEGVSNWPYPNAWIGCTAENQQLYDERWEILRQIPAAVRFISIEPMLSKIDLKLYDYDESCGSHSVRRYFLKWIIAGTESGSKRRPSKIEWIRNLRDQCVDAHVPFFLKQIERNGKVVKMPELDGQIWSEMPDIK